METATRFGPRQTVATLDATPVQPARTLPVTASFRLSEDGRKASLLAGGNGREEQEVRIEVPGNRLHLVSVDRQGVARLKLRPRYEADGDQRVTRVDAVPVYDVPPSIEDLFRAAAKNHELEHAYLAARTMARAKRTEGEQELRDRVAQAFLADATQRAIVHPPPTPKRCCLVTEHGRLTFEIARDTGTAQKVPAEAHRRFRADLRARDERAKQERAEQLAVHEEKKRYIAEWVATHGTPDQQARQSAGMLPMDEAIEAMTDQVFAAFAERPRYTRDGTDRLQAFLRTHAKYAEAVVRQTDLIVKSSHAVKATRAQWALMHELQAAKPDASVILRVHRLSWRSDPQAPSLTLFGVLVTCKVGPFTLRREYVAPDS